MTSVEQTLTTPAAAPPDVEDRLLWRDAQQTLDRHGESDGEGHCVWCGQSWPCPARRLAERADEFSRRPRRDTRNGPRPVPGWRADLVDAGKEDRPDRQLFD